MVPLASAARDDRVLAPEAMIVASGWPPPFRSQNSAMLRPHGLVASDEEALAQEVGERARRLLGDVIGQVVEAQPGHPFGQLPRDHPSIGDGVLTGVHRTPREPGQPVASFHT